MLASGFPGDGWQISSQRRHVVCRQPFLNNSKKLVDSGVGGAPPGKLAPRSERLRGGLRGWVLEASVLIPPLPTALDTCASSIGHPQWSEQTPCNGEEHRPPAMERARKPATEEGDAPVEEGIGE